MGNWERSPHRHGYWEDGKRLAYIGLSRPPVKPTIYYWYLDRDGTKGISGSLKDAKYQVMEHLKISHSR